MLVITDDATPAEIAEAFGHLATRYHRSRDRRVRAEIVEAVDDLLDVWLVR